MECLIKQHPSILILVDGIIQKEKALYVKGVDSSFFLFSPFSHILLYPDIFFVHYIEIIIYRQKCFLKQPYSTLMLVDGMFQKQQAL